MRTRWTRALVALATTTLVAGLAACGDGGSSATEPVDLEGRQVGAMPDYAVGTQFTATEPISISMLFSDHPNYPVQDDWLFWQELAARTNVTLEPSLAPMSDYEQARSLRIGAGDAPILIPKTYPGQENAFVASGAILPVSDYLDLMPNFRERIEQWDLAADIDSLRQADGRFYLLPGLHEEVWQDYTLAFRTDELTRLGLATPTTWDELREVLRAIKAAHPDAFPMSDRFEGDALLQIAGPGFGTSAGWSLQGEFVTWNGSEYELTGASPEYRAMVEYFASLVEEGLLDPESFTQDDDAAIQDFVTGRSFAISTNAQNIVNDYRPTLSQIPGATVAKIRVPSGPAGDVIQGSRLENGLMLSSAVAEREDFVAIMQFVDWLFYSDDGQEFAKWGVEGTTYTTDAAGDRVLSPQITFAGLNPGAPEQLQRDYGFSGGNFAYGGTTDLLQSTFPAEEVAFQEQISTATPREIPPPAPFDEFEREEASLVESALLDAVQQATLQFITGARDLSTWDAYVAELQAAGADRYLGLVNEAQQRYAESNG